VRVRGALALVVVRPARFMVDSLAEIEPLSAESDV
jgi:hypothetical protein